MNRSIVGGEVRRALSAIAVIDGIANERGLSSSLKPLRVISHEVVKELRGKR